MCTSDALYSRAKQRKAQTATKPTQDNRILITPLSRQKGSQTLVEGYGFMSQSPSGRQDDRSKRGMFSFTNLLAVTFNVLMFLECRRQWGGAVRRSKIQTSIKHLSDRPPQNPFVAMSKRAPSWVLEVARGTPQNCVQAVVQVQHKPGSRLQWVD